MDKETEDRHEISRNILETAEERLATLVALQGTLLSAGRESLSKERLETLEKYTNAHTKEVGKLVAEAIESWKFFRKLCLSTNRVNGKAMVDGFRVAASVLGESVAEDIVIYAEQIEPITNNEDSEIFHWKNYDQEAP
jgi:hypothetical protein